MFLAEKVVEFWSFIIVGGRITFHNYAYGSEITNIFFKNLVKRFFKHKNTQRAKNNTTKTKFHTVPVVVKQEHLIRKLDAFLLIFHPSSDVRP